VAFWVAVRIAPLTKWPCNSTRVPVLSMSRYQVDVKPSLELRTRADIVFTRQKIAVFIDGCFWQGCPVHATRPKRNSDYWVPKLRRNADRDLETTARLEALGWAVLGFWKHEEVGSTLETIATTLRAWTE